VTFPPLETEDQARRLPAVAAVYEKARKSPGRGAMAEGCRDMLSAALEAAGVTLGAYEERILLEWLPQWEPTTVAVVAEVIRRAHLSALALREDGDE